MKISGNKLQKAKRKNDKFNRLLSGILCVTLIIISFSGGSFIQQGKVKAEEKILSNPRIVSDGSIEIEQKVTWDCVWFGSYPQAEVVPASKEYKALGKMMLQKEDLIRDDVLYQALQTEKDWDEQGDAVISGEKYRRIKKEDAHAVSTNHWKSGAGYHWGNDTDYHYFKYQPIKWRVLSVNGTEAFLLADQALDEKQYHTYNKDVTWESSTIRSWLNGYGASANKQNKDYGDSNFINTAFSTSARTAIKDTKVENEDNLHFDYQHGVDGGNDTMDKVFLLSMSEIHCKKYGFISSNANDKARRSKSSLYAKALGTLISTSANYVGNCWWWLRSPGRDSDYASYVHSDGWTIDAGTSPHVGDYNAVRPALNLNLAASSGVSVSNLWSYAGTVCSDGTVEEIKGDTSGEEISFDTNGLENIANPDIVQDNTKEAGQKVTWDCIWFGSYPQAEVIPENTDYFPLDGELIEPDDLVCNDALFQTLQKATGWDDLGDITIEGNKYRRIRKADATSVPSGVRNYKWENETEYHFFKYQPIKWRVLSVKDSEAFLLADKALDNKWYHDIFEKDATWEDRMIRSWLNGYGPSENKENKDYSNNNFVNTAFSKSDQSAIKITDVENDNNIYYGTDGGNNTKDKIFLLSESEVYTDAAKEYGFVSDCNVNDEARRAKSSVYAKALGTIAGNCSWWLRSQGENRGDPTEVHADGQVHCYLYDDFNNIIEGVRPALNITFNTSSDLYSYAGTVCSDGTEREVIGENEYIDEHVKFLQTSNTYQNLLKYCDLSQKAFRDYHELKDSYDAWRFARKKIFDNPYEAFLVDMIINEGTVQSQLKSFDVNLFSAQRGIINDVMKLIEGEVSITKDDKNKIQKLFITKDFSDDATYKLCQNIFGKKISDQKLKKIFQTYDTSNKFLGLLDDGKEIVDSIIDVINYSSILQAYYNTSEEFRVVLIQMQNYCKDEDVALCHAITQYLDIENQYDIRDKIIGKIVGNTIEVGTDLFKDSIKTKASNFLTENMDLSQVGTATASSILSFVQGMKIGYHIGTTIDNILFNSDTTADSYVAAYASARAASYLKLVLQDNSSKLLKNHSLKNAKLFCETFNMYKWIQEDVANKVIRWISENEQALLSKIFKDSEYEVAIYEWQIMKLGWENIKCHDGILLKKKTKCITIACPVNVKIADMNGKSVLEMHNDIVDYCDADAAVCIRNGIKYITVPDADYNVEITATDEGVMSYSIGSYDNFIELMKTVHYEDIELSKDAVYNGQIKEGESFTEKECALSSNGKVVECNSSIFTNAEKINIENVSLSQGQLIMEVNESYTLQASVAPKNASIKTLTWYSEDSNIATVNEYGKIVAKAVGATNIVCMPLNGSCVQICKLNVIKKSGEISPSPTVKPTISPDYSYIPVPIPTVTIKPSPIVSLSPSPTVSPNVSDNVNTPLPIPVVTPLPVATPFPVATQEPSVTLRPSILPSSSSKPSKKEDRKTGLTKKLKKGTQITDKKTKAVYKITGIGKSRTVEYTKSIKKNPISISVPVSVKIKGMNYKVTSIGKSAFKNNKQLRNVKIGKGITVIGADAFSKCTSLTLIVIPSKVKKIGDRAFYQCRSLRYIMFKTKKLTFGGVGKNVFSGGYSSPRIKTDKSVWKRYAVIFGQKGMTKRALYIIDPVRLVI